MRPLPEQLHFTQGRNPQPAFNPSMGADVSQGSPLRHSKSRSRSKDRRFVMKPPMPTSPNTYAPNRSVRAPVERSSPIRNSSSPVRQIISQTTSMRPMPPPMTDGRDKIYRDRIEAMTLDNASL